MIALDESDLESGVGKGGELTGRGGRTGVYGPK